MEYIEQKLIAGQLNNSYNQIKDCEIVKPSWKGSNTYGDTFFVKKRDSIKVSDKSTPTGDIVDSIEIEGQEFLLIFNGTNIEVAYDDGINYTGFGLTYERTSNTPYRLVEGKSGTGVIEEGFTIGDAYYLRHNKGVWDLETDYLYGDIVQDDGVDYISITANIEKQPSVNTDQWKVYSSDESGYDVIDYGNTPRRDVYQGGYLKLKIIKTGIRDRYEELVGQYILFESVDSNLQGIASEIHYSNDKEDFGDTDGTNDVLLNPDEVFVYISGTNLSGTRPGIGEMISISSEVSGIPVLASRDKVIGLHLNKTAGAVTGVKEIILHETEDDNEIIDITIYNGEMIVLTNSYIIHSKRLDKSNINLYPLDSIKILKGGLRLVPFGKMLVLFGKHNAVITPINGTTGSVGYVPTDLNYDNDLYSKYSVLSTMGSLYVLQDDKQFVQLNIKSVTNIDYDVETKNVITNVRGMFNGVYGDVYMNKDGKDINILNINGGATDYYRYNLEYLHWNTGQYPSPIYKFLDRAYGDEVYDLNGDTFDRVDEDYTQIVGFDFGGDNLYTLKQVQFIKLIFGLNADILDYELEVNYQLGGNILTTTIDLSNYPINLELGEGSVGLGDSLIGTTLIGEGVGTTRVALGNFVSITVGLGLTGSVFNFNIKSKENEFIYGGSIIGYDNKLPTVTEYNYKH